MTFTSHGPSAATLRRTASLLCAGAIALAAACSDAVTAPAKQGTDPAHPGRALGMVEVTFQGAGTSTMSATARWLGTPSLGSAAAPGLSLDLAPVGDGSASGIQLDPAGRGYADSGSTRYLYASFRVRNAGTDGTAYSVAHRNVTFVAYATPSTRAQTAVSSLTRFDGSGYADGTLADAIARSILPAHGVTGSGTTIQVVDAMADMQAFSESELASLPTAGGTPLAYGYVVRCVSSCSDPRTLAAHPAAGEYDGAVTFAVKLPVQATASDNPFTFSMIFLAVEDPTTRLTESVEEQGTGRVLVRAAGLPSPTVTLLGNATEPAGAYAVERLCRVRTAGTDPNAPLATLVDASGCTAGAVSLPTTVRVVSATAAPGGDGTSWATAFSTLQDALTCVRGSGACAGVTEIWVEKGVYYPDQGTGIIPDVSTATFAMIPGVSLYGGFAGTELTRDERNASANLTVLSGDLTQDDRNTDANFVEARPSIVGTNAAHVVTITGSSAAPVGRGTVIDGFTITAGFGDGGGLLCTATSGGSCSPTISHDVFSGNMANTAGGGVLLSSAGNTTISPRIADVTFDQNESATSGGGLGAFTGSTDVVSPELVRLTFTGNRSESAGGGAVWLTGSAGGVCTPRFVGATFTGNVTVGVKSGGAVYVDTCSPSFADALFYQNTAGLGSVDTQGAGGAMYITGTGVTAIVNATFALNAAAGDGGALYANVATNAPQLTNVISWENTTKYGTIAEVGTAGSMSIASSLIAGGCPASAACTGVIASDPQFVDIATGDLRLQINSPAVDAGDLAALPSDVTDIDGDGDTSERLPLDIALRPRVVDALGGGAKVDMGAHERQ